MLVHVLVLVLVLVYFGISVVEGRCEDLLLCFLRFRRFRMREAMGESEEETVVMKLVRVLDPRRRQAASS